MEEESLWRSRQLGEHSPTSLLLSLVFLNTKHLGFRSVDQHLRLSFTDVYGPDDLHPVNKETAVCIRVPALSQELPGEFRRSYPKHAQPKDLMFGVFSYKDLMFTVFGYIEVCI